MNPLTNIRSRQRQRENEVVNGIPDSASYHTEFRSSAYINAHQLSFNLTEGDLLAIFSEYGELLDVNLVRDKKTGKSRGFAFLAYADQRSTDLAVDNLNGYSIDGRIIGVDHVKDYKRLKDNPDYVDPKEQQEAPPSSNPAGAPTGILSGADAEAAEDRYGTTADERPGAGGSEQGARRAADVAGPSSISAMLREVELGLKDWRTAKIPTSRDVSDAKLKPPGHEASNDARKAKKEKKEKKKKHHEHSKEKRKRQNDDVTSPRVRRHSPMEPGERPRMHRRHESDAGDGRHARDARDTVGRDVDRGNARRHRDDRGRYHDRDIGHSDRNSDRERVRTEGDRGQGFPRERFRDR